MSYNYSEYRKEKVVTTIITILFIVGLIHLGARISARKIQATPSTYSFETLSKEPEGDEVFITRDDGARIRAISKGNGQVVLLAHGYGSTLLQWNVVRSKLLEKGYRVIAFDLRGHGKSTIGGAGIDSTQFATDYRAVIEYFNVEDGVLVGHSLGGFLAIVLALSQPQIAHEKLKGMVLLASTAGNIFKGSPQIRILNLLIRLGLAQRIIASKTYGWLLGTSFFGTPIPAAIKVLQKMIPAQPHKQLIPIANAMGAENYYSQLKNIKLPCVVICGKLDNTTPAWHSEKLGSKIPNARNIWLDGKGHMLNWEAPEEIINAIQSIK